MFHNWPWTNLHEINLDWVVKTVKEWHDKYGSVDDAIGLALQQVEQARTDSLSAIDGARQLSINAIGELQQAVMEAILAAGNGKVDQITAKGDEYLQSLAAMRDVLEDALQARGEQVLATIPSEYTELYNQVRDNTGKLFEKAPAIGEAMFAELVHFSDGAANYPFTNLRSFIEPVQAGSGIASPSNVRPISGWTEANLTRTGENLLDFDEWNGTGIVRGSGVWANYGVSITAGAEGDAYTEPANMKIECKPGIKYVLSWAHSGAEGGVYIFPNGSTERLVLTVSGSGHLEYTAQENDNFFTFRVGVTAPNATATYSNVRINIASDRGFSPYRGQMYTAQFGQTVYGGEYNWKTGVLRRNKVLINLGDYTWVRDSNYPIFRTEQYFQDTYLNKDVVCTQYASYGLDLRDIINNNNSICLIGGYIWIRDDRYTDPAAFKTALSGVMMLAELVTPEETRLAPQEISSLYGVNNLWSNNGKTSAFYISDTKLYIDGRISAILAMNIE